MKRAHSLTQQAFKRQAEEEKLNEKLLSMDDRSRPYNSGLKHAYAEPTAEEIEAYQLKRRNRDDPMADFV